MINIDKKKPLTIAKIHICSCLSKTYLSKTVTCHYKCDTRLQISRCKFKGIYFIFFSLPQKKNENSNPQNSTFANPMSRPPNQSLQKICFYPSRQKLNEGRASNLLKIFIQEFIVNNTYSKLSSNTTLSFLPDNFTKSIDPVRSNM